MIGIAGSSIAAIVYTRGKQRGGANAPVKKSLVIRNATHFVLFEKPRFEFFNAIHDFLREAL